ncbi:MAG TPA: hypothetical protein VEJ87_12935 [Acidimicrobiales bacterium]|nr:hypothetical protein [Acidimicrobiales bacterium]
MSLPPRLEGLATRTLLDKAVARAMGTLPPDDKFRSGVEEGEAKLLKHL